MNEIIFDSNEYTGLIKAHLCVVDNQTNETLSEALMPFTNVTVSKVTAFYLISLTPAEDGVIGATDQLNRLCQEGDRHMRMTLLPFGVDSPLAYYGRISGPIFRQDADYSITGKTTFFARLEPSDFFEHNRIISKEEFERLSETAFSPTPEERTFLAEAMEKQARPDWFPLPRENARRREEQAQKEAEALRARMVQMQNNISVPIPQENDVFNAKSLKVIKGSADPMGELSRIVGLQSVKEMIEKLKYRLEFDKERAARGFQSEFVSNLHMCFLGNPGTGKTTIARIMTGILHETGAIRENKCVEVNALEMIGGFIGQTGIITAGIIREAMGGVLFIDEAYALKDSGMGNEAISVLLKEMEDNRGDLTVIFAGYEREINEFLNMNEGFRSRINHFFRFEDYSTVELGQILLGMLKKAHLKITEAALYQCLSLFNEAKNAPNFSNGRFVRNLFEQLEESHILHVYGDSDDARMDTVTREDIDEKLKRRVLSGI